MLQFLLVLSFDLIDGESKNLEGVLDTAKLYFSLIPLLVSFSCGDFLFLIEGGINVNSPVEVAAYNDIVAYRRQYGRDMGYQGGIDKRALAKGGDVMRAELLRVIPPMLEDGGYIPGCDHGVPPDISWPNFQEYVAYLKELTGWT